MSGLNRYWEKGGIVRFLLILFGLLFFSCSGEQTEVQPVERINTIGVTTDLIIGKEDQPPEHQLGRPVVVRSDDEGNIYIADRGSMEIKVFGQEGNYLKSLGGRGRGPGEFQDFNLMEWTPEGHLVLLDTGNLQYTIISTEGEQVDTFPYHMRSNPFYPSSISYMDGQLLGLFLRVNPTIEIPEFERDLFHIYSTDFQTRHDSFMPVKSQGFEEMFLWALMIFHNGSFSLSEDKKTLVFSPCTYMGDLFVYQKQETGSWQFERTLQGAEPRIEPYQLYNTEQQYRNANDAGVARASRIRYGGESHLGRQLSMDAGIFHLNDGRLVHFYAEWREGYHSNWPDSDSHLMDLYVQIFDREGELQAQSFLFSFMERFRAPQYSVVNWMDEEKNFYLLEHPEDIPTIRRFSLELPE